MQGYSLGICLLLSTSVSLAEDKFNLEVKSFNSSVVDVACTYKGEEMDIFYDLYRDKHKCIYLDPTGCNTYGFYDCKFQCTENTEANSLPFLVNLNGSCNERILIRCSARSIEQTSLVLDTSLLLTAQGDPPEIFVNNGERVESNSEPVPITCKVGNRCDQTELEISGVHMLPAMFSHMSQGNNRFTTTANTTATFFEPRNYTITCKEKGKEDYFARRLTIEVHEKSVEEHGKQDEEESSPGQSLTIGLIAATAIFALSTCIFGMLFFCHRRNKNKMQHKEWKKPEMLQLKDSFCGIWVEQDKSNGEKISDFITKRGGEVCRAEIENIHFLQEGSNFARYFALISSDSFNNKTFLAYLMSVIGRISNVKHKSTFVLVLLAKNILSNSKNQQNKSLLKDLKTFPYVEVFHELDDNLFNKINRELQGFPLDTGAFFGFRTIGIGLAWNYFCGYLALILPDMKERIKKSECYKKHSEKMSPHFIIIIPESSRTPAKLNEIDRRFSRIGPLDKGITKARAGHPERLYNNFVHQIREKREDDCIYFCGEYATTVSTLYKLVEQRKLNEVDMIEQLHLFIETLQSILLRHPDCRENAVVFSSKDVSKMADELCELIKTPKPLDQIEDSPVNEVTRVAEGLALSYYYNYLTIIGPEMANRIKRAPQYSKKRMPRKLFILLPYSCYCYQTLESADENNIVNVGNLDPHVIDIAGNNRPYETTIHKISAGRETFFACVEYCTPVQVMFEMEQEGNETGLPKNGEQAGLQPEDNGVDLSSRDNQDGPRENDHSDDPQEYDDQTGQPEKEEKRMVSPPREFSVHKATELRVFYEILYDLLHGPSAQYCENFHLIYYNDLDETRTLSGILVDEIKQSLKGKMTAGRREAVTYDKLTTSVKIETD